MSLLTIVLVLIVVGILLWLVKTYLPIDPPIKNIITVVVVVAVVVWLLQVFGLFDLVSAVHVGRRR